MWSNPALRTGHDAPGLAMTGTDVNRRSKFERRLTFSWRVLRPARQAADLPCQSSVSRSVQRAGFISSRAVLGGLHHHYGRV
jgi:hypothetical protein